MLSVIDAKLEQYPIHWNWCHVKGHQENQIGSLDQWASLNIECEKAANQIWYQYQYKPQL